MKKDKDQTKEYRRDTDRDFEYRRREHRPQDTRDYRKLWDRENYYSSPDDYADER